MSRAQEPSAPGPALREPAPELGLRDQHGAEVTLSSLRGRPVLVVFYPYAFSGVCTGELHALRDRSDELEGMGAAVVGVSCDPMFSLRVFADRDGIEFPLLSDFWPHGAAARRYGVLDERHGCPRRSTFLVDDEGVLRWSLHHGMGEARDVDDYVRALDGLGVTGER